MEHFEIHNVIKENMDYKNKYYWTFRIESSRYYGEKDPDSLGFITEENREANFD